MTPTRPVDNVVIATKGLQDRNTNIIAGTTVENKGKLILIRILSYSKFDFSCSLKNTQIWDRLRSLPYPYSVLLWVVCNRWTEFGWNCTKRSRVLKYFFHPFIIWLLRLLGLRYAYSVLLWVVRVSNMCTKFSSNCPTRSRSLKYFSTPS